MAIGRASKLATKLEELCLLLQADEIRLEQDNLSLQDYLIELEKVSDEVSADDPYYDVKMEAVKQCERMLRSASFTISSMRGRNDDLVSDLEDAQSYLEEF